MSTKGFMSGYFLNRLSSFMLILPASFKGRIFISRSLYKKSSGIFIQWWIVDPFFMTVYSCTIHPPAILCKKEYNIHLSVLKAINTINAEKQKSFHCRQKCPCPGGRPNPWGHTLSLGSHLEIRPNNIFGHGPARLGSGRPLSRLSLRRGGRVNRIKCFGSLREKGQGLSQGTQSAQRLKAGIN